jgi:signal transduction histidine kinase
MKYASRVFIIVLPLLFATMTFFIYYIEPLLNNRHLEFIVLILLAIGIALLSVANTLAKIIAPFEEVSQSLEKVKKWEFIKIDAKKYPLVEDILSNYNHTINLILAKEKSLVESNDRLKELDLKKSNFINVASHELRTPMTVIKWYISMMLDGDLGKMNEETLVYLSRVFKSTNLLLDLVNDMLDISKMESEKMIFTYETFEYVAFLWNIMFDMNKLASVKNMHITHTEKFDRLDIYSDTRKLTRVLINIIGNAIKFTPEWGKIDVTSWVAKGNLYIAIKDTGMGIATENIPYIFDKFSQIDNPLTRDIQWTGLGLSISKKITECLGGEIHVESTLGVGTTFTVVLNNFSSTDRRAPQAS